MIELTGIAWNHTRGYLPMVATAQRFAELHPDVNITWHKRSLQAFADAPLADLAARFDLMVIDHPSIGGAAHLDLLLPLDLHLPAAFLADQKQNSVGQSHDSYNIDGHQYALAIDAATPISGFRPDLLARAGAEPPRTWSELLALAHRGLVTVPIAFVFRLDPRHSCNTAPHKVAKQIVPAMCSVQLESHTSRSSSRASNRYKTPRNGFEFKDAHSPRQAGRQS